MNRSHSTTVIRGTPSLSRQSRRFQRAHAGTLDAIAQVTSSCSPNSLSSFSGWLGLNQSSPPLDSMTNQVGNSTFWMSASFDDWIRRILDACSCHMSTQDIWFCHSWSSIVSNSRKQWHRMQSRSTHTCSLSSFVRPRISLVSFSPTIHGVAVVWYPHISATSVDLSATVAGSVGPRLLPYGTDNLPVKLATLLYSSLYSRNHFQLSSRLLQKNTMHPLPSDEGPLPSDEDPSLSSCSPVRTSS